MPFAKVLSGAVIGIQPITINIEVHIDNKALPRFTIVGLASREVEESKERVRSAIKNSRFKFPTGRITVNLSPADITKKGSLYDLPIAIGILLATQQVRYNQVKPLLLLGELSLDGTVKKVSSTFAIVSELHSKYNTIVPKNNYKELSILEDLNVILTSSLKDCVQKINNFSNDFYEEFKVLSAKFKSNLQNIRPSQQVSFEDIKGQDTAKLALLIAAAGCHHVAMTGSPGTGKTMLAKAFTSILPPLTQSQQLNLLKIYSVANEPTDKILQKLPPIRSPHHTLSKPALLGGGNPIKSGEITLATHGVLFLDEFPELPRDLIEALRQPLENKIVTISRINQKVTFPSDFILLIASNPCPCGNLFSENTACVCKPSQIKRYQEKLSGPIADRIDLHTIVNNIKISDIFKIPNKKFTTPNMRKLVLSARKIQASRYKKLANDPKCNAKLSPKQIERFIKITPNAQKFLIKYMATSYESMRSYHKILKIAQTIADLEQEKVVTQSHIELALKFRPQSVTNLLETYIET